MSLVDPYGRRIGYLRLAVTDRCNLRCRYCRPAAGPDASARADLLSLDELEFVARVAVGTGIEKIRITGGEPLLREGMVPFLARLRALPGLSRLVLTTNGTFLAGMAAELRAAGVESLNVSLDSLRPERFARITRGGELRGVLAGIDAAEQAGFPHLKINVVLLRGVNDDEAVDFAETTLLKGWSVRFIEFMPTVATPDWQRLFVPAEELVRTLGARFRLLPEAGETMGGPAKYFRIEGARGRIGVIAPMSCHFCTDCNRIRVSANGVARSCLFSEREIDLRPPIRAGDEAGLRAAFRRIVDGKPKGHRMKSRCAPRARLAMSEVGG